MKLSTQKPHECRRQLLYGTLTALAMLLLFMLSAIGAYAITGYSYPPALREGASFGIGFAESPAQPGVGTPTLTTTSTVVSGTPPASPQAVVLLTSTAIISPTITPITTTTPVITGIQPISPTVSLTPTETVSPTATPTSTATASPSPTASRTATATPTATRTATSSPTASPTALPTATPTPKPVEPAALLVGPTPTAPQGPEPGDRFPQGSPIGQPMIVAVAAVIVLVILLGATLFLFRRRRMRPSQTEPPPPSPTPGPPVPLAEKPSLLTSSPPQPGIPYLEGRTRTETLYCRLAKQAITIGRDTDNDLIVDAGFEGWQTVSRRHAVIEYDGRRAVVVDQGSRNGVYVNGRRAGTNVLQDGWTVRFGKVEFIFRTNQGGVVS